MTHLINFLAVIGALVVIACLVSICRGIFFAHSVEPGGRCPICKNIVPLKAKS